MDKTATLRMARRREKMKLSGIPDAAPVNLQIVNALAELHDQVTGLEAVVERAVQRLVDREYDAVEAEKAVRARIMPN